MIIHSIDNNEKHLHNDESLKSLKYKIGNNICTFVFYIFIHIDINRLLNIYYR